MQRNVQQADHKIKFTKKSWTSKNYQKDQVHYNNRGAGMNQTARIENLEIHELRHYLLHLYNLLSIIP